MGALAIGRQTKKQREEKQLACIVKDIIKSDIDVSDVGTILACFKGDVKSLQTLKDECSNIDVFLEVAAKRANVALVTAAIEAAIGYDYVETDQKISILYQVDDDGNVTKKEVPGELKVKTKHAKKNDQLLKFILSNRLPEYFSDIKKVEINKKSIDLKGDITKEIEGFAGKLLDVIETDFVVETDND